VLKSNFVLVGTMYGIPHCEYAYEDIFFPRQVVSSGKSIQVQVPA
jgi:hypothetical protein